MWTTFYILYLWLGYTSFGVDPNLAVTLEWFVASPFQSYTSILEIFEFIGFKKFYYLDFCRPNHEIHLTELDSRKYLDWIKTEKISKVGKIT